MRHFTDEQGRSWDVVVGRESWGAPVLLFTERAGDAIRQAPLAAQTMLDAGQALAELSDDELRERLAGAVDWGG